MPQPRTVLVTGASSGIGEATAHLLAQRGDHLVLTARGEESLDRVAEECNELGAASTTTRPADIADDDAVRRVVSDTIAQHGRLDLVVGCAGVVAYGRLEDVPVEVFDTVLATNLHGSANLARHVVPVLRQQGEGSMVLVGSVLGHVAVPEMSAYVISKWGVRALVRQLQLDNRDCPGIRFGYVAPGGVDTPIYRQAATYGQAAGRPPFPVATPERVARQILAVSESSWQRSQTGVSNDVIRFGFTAMPWLYDRLVGPLFRVVAQDLTATVAPDPGNVLASRPQLNGLRGGHGSALLGVGRNVAAVLRGKGEEHR